MRHRRIGRRKGLGERAVVADLAIALQQAGDELLAVDAEREGPADALVGQGAGVATHVHLLVRGALLEGGAYLRGELLKPERAGAVPVLLVIALVARGQDDAVVIVGRHHIGERAIGRIEVELDRQVVDGLGVPLRQDALEGRQGVRGIVRIAEPVDGGRHVGGRQRSPALELDAQHRAVAHEAAPVETPGQQLVDQVVVECAEAATKRIEMSEKIGHDGTRP